MNIYEKLLNVQMELKVPKGQYNSFGKYKYRSCEDILEGLKPVLEKKKLALFITDELINLESRYYVRATVHLINTEKTDEIIKVSALAREEETKKGMDGSQITGTSSSYARKYALNGLFAIDDTKDSDSTNTHGKKEEKVSVKNEEEDRQKAINLITKELKEEDDKFVEQLLSKIGKPYLGSCTKEELKNIYTKIKEKNKGRS